MALAEALRKQHMELEELIFPDEVHGFLTKKRWLDTHHAAEGFPSKHLQ
jgi:dipeptidyl aminopeptidase/acylaminoacyl peptidase